MILLQCIASNDDFVTMYCIKHGFVTMYCNKHGSVTMLCTKHFVFFMQIYLCNVAFLFSNVVVGGSICFLWFFLLCKFDGINCVFLWFDVGELLCLI